MTNVRPGFDPGELRGGEGPEPTDAELAQAWAMARELGPTGSGDRTPADPAFVSRVMAAIEQEPSPRPVAAGGKAVRELRLAGVVASFRDAWRVAFGPGRTVAARAGALAYVLVAVVVLGSFTGVAVVGTAALLAPDATQTPQPSGPAVQPNGTPVGPPQSTAPRSPEPGPSTSPSTEPGPSSEPEESDEPDETGSPGSTLGPGGTLGPGQTASPSPAAGATSSPESSRTPRPSSSPSSSPSGTPKPTSSSGGGGTPQPSSSPD